MARSIGDHAVKDVGVIAEPVVTVHEVKEEDEFLILATDGVWEFIGSEDAVKIVSKHLYCKDGEDDGEKCASKACEALIKAAMAKWHEYEGDYRDDITAIVVRLQDIWKYH
jgi:serine/threonine protein phosphatase PrpC